MKIARDSLERQEIKKANARARTAKWRKNNPTYYDEWYKANAEKERARAAARRQSDPDYYAKWRKANADREKAKDTERWKANANKYNAQRRGHYKANPDEINARNLVWKKANPDRVRSLAAAWRLANPDKVKAYAAKYRKNNADKKAEGVRNRRARKLLAPGTHTAADIASIRALQKDRCAYCRKKLRGRGHIDHIIPLVRGGSNWPRNLQWLCAKCNGTKWSKDPIEFARENGMLI